MIRLVGYAVREKFHDGSNTQLYRGTRDVDQAPVVIKVPRSEYPSSREIARLQHEYRLLSELRIPGVARAYALEKLGRGMALIMERLPGQPLQMVLRSRQLALGECLKIGIELCRILEALHGHHLVHKDIKPQTVITVENRRVYVTGTLPPSELGRYGNTGAQRREPERTGLHRMVRENLAAFLAEAAVPYSGGDFRSSFKARSSATSAADSFVKALPAFAAQTAVTSGSSPFPARIVELVCYVCATCRMSLQRDEQQKGM